MTDTGTVASSQDQDTRRLLNQRRIIVVVLIVLLLLLGAATYFLASIMTPAGRVASVEEAGGLEWVRSIYGFGDTLDEQLRQPNDVAIAPDGTIWVTDQTRQQVVGFNPDGTYKALIHKGPRGSSPEALSLPNALAVDEDGTLYIADSVLDRVIVMSPDNEKIGEYIVPDPLAVAVKGDRVVVGSVSGFVVMAKDGEIIRLLGKRGKGDEEFDSVQGVAITDDDRIIAVDQFNNRLSAYDLDGNRLWIRSMGSPSNSVSLEGGGSMSAESTAEAQMILPARVTLDGAGRLVIVDVFDFSLAVLDSENGDLIAKYGAFGDAEGQFTYPLGISYDAERDWFAVTDLYNSRVEIVRIPDSGASPTSVVARTLAGPWRACLVPLALLVLILVVAYVIRKRNSRAREMTNAQQVGSQNEATLEGAESADQTDLEISE